MSDESSHTPKNKRVLDDILGATAKNNPIGELLSGAPVKKSTPMEVLRTSFAGLPPIPGISPEEHRNMIMLQGALLHEMHRMMASWMIVDDMIAGREPSDRARAIEERLSTGIQTNLAYPDAWELGIAMVKPLHKAYQKNSGDFEKELSTLYWRCKYDETWDGDYESFATTVVELLKKTSSEDIALAQQLMQQYLSEGEYNSLRRIATAVDTGTPVAAKDTQDIVKLAYRIKNYHSMPDATSNALPEIFSKIRDAEPLDDVEKTQLKEAANLALAHPPLSPAERSQLKKRPQIEEFADFVTQTGFMNFGALGLAYNELHGRLNKEEEVIEGAMELHQEYARYAQAPGVYCNHSDLAELHRMGMTRMEKAQNLLTEVKGTFLKENLIDADIPKPDLGTVATMLDEGKKLSEVANKAAWSAEKIYKRKREKLPGLDHKPSDDASFRYMQAGTKASLLLRGLQRMEKKIKDRFANYNDFFAANVDALSKTMHSGVYETMDTNHKDLILYIQNFQAVFQEDIEIARTGIIPLLEKEKKGAKKEYVEILSAVEEGWKKIIDEEEKLASSIAAVHTTLTQGMDHLARSSVAAERMIDYAETILRHMKERQQVLDQYAAAEARTTSAITGSPSRPQKGPQ